MPSIKIAPRQRAHAVVALALALPAVLAGSAQANPPAPGSEQLTTPIQTTVYCYWANSKYSTNAVVTSNGVDYQCKSDGTWYALPPKRT